MDAETDVEFLNNNDYCAICLKTPKQAGLVTKHAEDFFRAVQMKQATPWICVWCSAKLRHFQDLRSRAQMSLQLLRSVQLVSCSGIKNENNLHEELHRIRKEAYVFSSPAIIFNDITYKSSINIPTGESCSAIYDSVIKKINKKSAKKADKKNKTLQKPKRKSTRKNIIKREKDLKVELLEEEELNGKADAIYADSEYGNEADELCIDSNLKDQKSTVSSEATDNVQIKQDPLHDDNDSRRSWTSSERILDIGPSVPVLSKTGVWDFRDTIPAKLTKRKTKKMENVSKRAVDNKTRNELERADAIRREINQGAKLVVLRETDDMRYATSDVVRANVAAVTLSAEEERRAHAHRLRARRYRDMRYRCRICAVGSASRLLHDKHMRKHSPGAFRCDVCETYHGTRTALNAHVTRHYRAFRCRACAACFPSLQHAANHYFTQHAGIHFRCAHCDNKYRSLVYLKKHLATHSRVDGQKTSTCNICNKVYDTCTSDSKYRFNSHVRSHEEGKLTFECPVCKKTVVASRRSNHMKVHAESVLCTVCLKTFRCKDTLQQHTDRIHTQSKRYQCDTCGKLFFGKSDVRTHIEWTHMKLGGVTCAVCGMTFRKEYILLQHTRKVHENNPKPKDKLCDICGRGFTQRSIMEQHRLIHTGAKPHKCEQCGQTFRQKTAMNTHFKLKHLNVKWSDMIASRKQRKKGAVKVPA